MTSPLPIRFSLHPNNNKFSSNAPRRLNPFEIEKCHSCSFAGRSQNKAYYTSQESHRKDPITFCVGSQQSMVFVLHTIGLSQGQRKSDALSPRWLNSKSISNTANLSFSDCQQLVCLFSRSDGICESSLEKEIILYQCLCIRTEIIELITILRLSKIFRHEWNCCLPIAWMREDRNALETALYRFAAEITLTIHTD